MANPFERIVRSPLEYSFDSKTDDGVYGQQIVKEMERTSHILMDATYMPSNEDSRHRGKRDEESAKMTAVTLASDEGDAISGNGHTTEYTVELGTIGDGCKYNSIQRRNAHAEDVLAKERQDISNTIEGINRFDSFLTVYGNSEAIANDTRCGIDKKAWKGMAYYTRKLMDYDKFISDYYANRNPFVATKVDDLCLTLDNQRTNTNTTAYKENAYSSIYAVVWGTDALAKLYPKNSMSMGIETEVYDPSTVQYVPRDNADATRLYKEGYITFRKTSGLNVHDRFGLIRLANIQFDPTNADQMKAEMKRIVENMALIEEILGHKGWQNRVKFYAPESLIRTMRIARYLDGQPQVIYADNRLDQIGQRHGLAGDTFILNDNFAITAEYQMQNNEKKVTR